eukprot:gene21965-61995_t
MAEINAKRISVRATINSNYDDSEKKQDESFAVMIAIVVVIVLLLMAVSVVFTLFIVRPLHTLDRQMVEVAKMKLEAVPEGREFEYSKLMEVKSMQKSFVRMVKNFREFKNYMPASLKLKEAELSRIHKAFLTDCAEVVLRLKGV